MQKDDVIYRREAIGEVQRFLGYIDQDMIDRLKIAIGRLPSAQPEILACGSGELVAQPEQRWIPVSEKPIEKGLMLVTYNDGDVDLLKQPTAYRYSDIVAWMPVPKPYRRGEADEPD